MKKLHWRDFHISAPDKIKTAESRIVLRKRFNMIELMIVISVIVIMAGLLLPALNKARETTKRISCANKQKQLCLGIDMYATDNSDWLVVGGASLNEWRLILLPYVAPNLRAAYKVICHKNTIFWCPSCTAEEGIQQSGIGWNWNLGYSDTSTIRPRIKRTKIQEPSRTIMIGDTNDSNSGVIHYLYSPIDYSIEYIGTRHSNGINVAYSDSHIQWHPTIYLLSHGELYNY